MHGPRVDIVVPARDEAPSIGPVIASLLAQDYGAGAPGSFAVTLVDDNSTDGTAERAGRAPNLNILRGRPEAFGMGGQNVGARAGDRRGRCAAHLVDRRRHHARAAASIDARGLLGALATRHGERDGAPQLLEPRGACAGPGVRLLLSDAVPVRPGERCALERCGGGRRHRIDSPRGAAAHRRHRRHQGRAHRRRLAGESHQGARRAARFSSAIRRSLLPSVPIPDWRTSGA